MNMAMQNNIKLYKIPFSTPKGQGGGGGGVLVLIFAGNVPLASQSPYPIIVYSMTNYRPHLRTFWAYI